jgi:CoA:oxalate CoA-transferase
MVANPKRLALRVVELADGVAGPYCGRILAGFGADVIKIEHPCGGDSARRLRPFKDDIPDDEHSGFFAYLNANKRGITLDWSNPTGRSLLRQLLGWADVVLTSGAVRADAGLHLSGDEAIDAHPQIVSVAITNFGETGPYRDYQGVEITLQAMGGIMARNGLRDREPLREWGYQAQFIAGANAIPACLSAVFRARRTGVGAHIDLAIVEAVVQFLQSTLMKWSFEGVVAGREAQSKAANTIYPCKDGYAGIFAPGSGTGWRNAAMLMEDPRLGDPKFKTQALREQHADELDALIYPWTLDHSKDEIYHTGQSVGLPYAPVRSTAEFLAAEHHRVRGYIRTVDHPVLGRYSTPGMPFRLDGLDWQDAPSPTLGRHNVDVYGELCGLSAGHLLNLHERGVI